ncbi:MAG: MbcA/ParS/Xre antitoxin family protein [Bryobacteraceae bacterium]
MLQTIEQHKFEAIHPDRRRDPKVRRQLSGPAMRAFFQIASGWGLSVGEQIALLGYPAESTYFKYKASASKTGKDDGIGTLSFDTLMRISLLLGIYKALHILFADESLANQWVMLPNSNPLFGGQPALALMTSGMDGLHQVRRLLDGRRG